MSADKTPDNGAARPPARLPGNGGVPSVAVARALLATAPGRRKRDLIFEAADPAAFVRRLPAEDVYFALREIGLTDAADVVALASPSQFRTFVDLDAWRRDAPDPERVLLWLRLAHEGDPRGLRSRRKALDAEVMLLLLKKHTTVHFLEQDDQPVLTSSNFLRTPEGKYVVEINAEGDEGAVLRRVLDDYIDEDPFQAARVFEAVRWELASELEDTALRWRSGRLRDLGFPEFEEAIRIWTPLPAGTDLRARTTPEPGAVAGVPALLLVSGTAPLFLDRVVQLLPDELRPRFNEGLVYLLNCSLVADGIDPADLDRSRATLAAARDMLSLGLELASDGDATGALALLASVAPVDLFRAAVTRLQTLARDARKASDQLSRIAPASTLLDAEESQTLGGLLRRRPRLYDPPPPGTKGEEWRAYRDRADLDRAAAALARAQAAAGVLEALHLDRDSLQSIAQAAGRATTAVSLTHIVLTAAMRALLGDAAEPLPLAAGEVPRACPLFADKKLSGQARARWDELVAGLRAGLAEEPRAAFDQLASRWLARLEDELGPPCAAGGLDARFVECVLVCAGAA